MVNISALLEFLITWYEALCHSDWFRRYRGEFSDLVKLDQPAIVHMQALNILSYIKLIKMDDRWSGFREYQLWRKSF